MPTPGSQPPIALRVDALARFGVGHLVRLLALAEEFAARGRRVRLFGVTDLDWAREQAASRGLAFEAPDADASAFAARLRADGVRLCVVDGYEISDAVGAALRASGIGVAALVDGEFGLGQDADVYVDQNLGASPRPDVHAGASFLVGPRYVLLRDVVLRRRRPAPEASSGTPRVLVVFGGSDPFDGCRRMVELLLATGMAVEIVAVAARDEVADAVGSLPAGPGQSVLAVPIVDDLPALAVTCDAAVTASGSTVWELACLGVPTALVCVTDNQELGYREATRSLCLPAGHLAALHPGGADVELALASVRRLLGDPACRTVLAREASGLVDGLGRRRVADALTELEHARRHSPAG